MKSGFTSRTSWREKLEKVQEPKLVNIPPRMSHFGKGSMLIPTPKLVDQVIRKVPKRKLVTVSEIRRKLAADFSADVTCPLTTGIFVRIVAEAAEEALASGKKKVTAYWRVIKDDGSLNPKFPGGQTRQAQKLRDEGFSLAKDGNKILVRDFESYLATLTH